MMTLRTVPSPLPSPLPTPSPVLTPPLAKDFQPRSSPAKSGPRLPDPFAEEGMLPSCTYQQQQINRPDKRALRWFQDLNLSHSRPVQRQDAVTIFQWLETQLTQLHSSVAVEGAAGSPPGLFTKRPNSGSNGGLRSGLGGDLHVHSGPNLSVPSTPPEHSPCFSSPQRCSPPPVYSVSCSPDINQHQGTKPPDPFPPSPSSGNKWFFTTAFE